MGSWWRGWANVRVLSVVSGFCCSVAACDGTSPSGENSGGTAGTVGSGGATGKGGSAGSGGSGGGAGSTAGTAGEVSGGSAGAAGVAGTTSAGATNGGESGVMNAGGGDAGSKAGSSGTGGEAGSNDNTSGASGVSGSNGTGGGAAWDAACNGVTNNGRCNGNVYEWCDYFTRGVLQLDCTPLGMTCRAEPEPDQSESRGCIASPCTSTQENRCEGPLRYHCQETALLAFDCRKLFGPSSECESDGGSIDCTMNHPCDTPNVTWCEDDLYVICTEESTLYYKNCKRDTDDGRCVPGGDITLCDPSVFD
jgi:hypothetical protein